MLAPVWPLVFYGWCVIGKKFHIVLWHILRCWQYGPAAANGREALALDPGPWSLHAAAAGDDVRRLLLPRQQQIWHLDLLCPQQSFIAWERDATANHHALLFAGPGTSLFGYDASSAGNFSQLLCIHHSWGLTCAITKIGPWCQTIIFKIKASLLSIWLKNALLKLTKIISHLLFGS